LHEESGIAGSAEDAKDEIRRYIESTPKNVGQNDAWEWLSRICLKTGDWAGEIHALLEMCKLPEAPLLLISNSANRLNGLLGRRELSLDSGEKQIIVREFIKLMEDRLGEANAVDFSRLAWMCWHLQDRPKAEQYTRRGLEKDPVNEHCIKLARKLGII
jgi:hypothetical protein